jgi:hypothetical protein
MPKCAVRLFGISLFRLLPPESTNAARSAPIGSCPSGKLQRILANQLFSQHANLNMAGFVLYLLGSFALRCSQHPAVSSQQSVKRKPTSKAFYRTRRPGRKAEPYAHVPARAVSTPDDCAKPTPFWDHLGCGGIPREGVPRRARLSPESPTSHVIAGIGR